MPRHICSAHPSLTRLEANIYGEALSSSTYKNIRLAEWFYYFPWKLGRRRSAKARTPSLKSSEKPK